MSELTLVKRYYIWNEGSASAHPDGDWVRYDEIVHLLPDHHSIGEPEEVIGDTASKRALELLGKLGFIQGNNLHRWVCYKDHRTLQAGVQTEALPHKHLGKVIQFIPVRITKIWITEDINTVGYHGCNTKSYERFSGNVTQFLELGWQPDFLKILESVTFPYYDGPPLPSLPKFRMKQTLPLVITSSACDCWETYEGRDMQEVMAERKALEDSRPTSTTFYLLPYRANRLYYHNREFDLPKHLDREILRIVSKDKAQS